MKKISIILASLFGVLTLTTSCNDEWTEEQYEKYVSFKSPLNDNGVTSCYVPFTRHNEDGTVKYAEGVSDYDLPVIIAGSTANNRNLTVHVAHSDTLTQLNYERFQLREDLYYKDMSEWCEYPSTVTIPSGQDIGLLNIKFNFKQNNEVINMVDKWVLPIEIVDEGYDYESHPRKHYAKSMLRVYPFNDFSGDYSATALKLANSADATNSIGMEVSRAYVYDENTVFFYMGNIDETNIHRGLYKVYARFIPGVDKNGEEDKNKGTVQMWTDNPNTNFKWTGGTDGVADYRIDTSTDGTLHYLVHRYVVISNISYQFDDYSLADPYVFHYSVSGNLTLERQINTQIPDEDQAYIW